MECCERKREKDKGKGEVPGRGSTRCSACSLTDLWISLLSARGWLRRLTRAASGCRNGEGRKGGRTEWGRSASFYGPVGIPAAPKSEAHTFIPAVLARSLSHHERFPTSRRPTSKTANVFPPPATGNPVRPPITPGHVTRITSLFGCAFSARLYRTPRCRIMTLADLKGLQRVTCWRVPEYARLRPTSSSRSTI
ncbi:hypothetical protein ALC57_14034 [Trachymyrmex cornetzi]|uniref:Uncharacterized protein n=1 Tax=Trachymyrmex cornetzi TaxID=471704 RepID=A0A195DM43_9HYME|nr:hypothetical protein ALC57_14034 [Trachymyrmex cornetzi]